MPGDEVARRCKDRGRKLIPGAGNEDEVSRGCR